jgi:hypothetical protein
MARPLSFLFQTQPGSGAEAAQHLTAAFSRGAKADKPPAAAPAAGGTAAGGNVPEFPRLKLPPPAIVHYAWVNFLPAAFGPDWVLLTTAYDEKFAPYITDLVNHDPAPFNKAVATMKDYDQTLGFPVETHLGYFVQYIQDRDLAQTGRDPKTGAALPLFEAYGWTVNQIYNMPPKHAPPQ